MNTASVPAWVYMLRLRDGRLYTGWAVDPVRRLAAHRAGRGSRLLRAIAPEAIVYLEPMPDRSAALRREAAIKRMRRAGKMLLLRESAARTAQHLRRLDSAQR